MTTSDAWIRRFNPAPQAPTRLVCLPHAGGAASYYLPVAKALGPDVEVLSIQYPGRQDRRHEPFIRTVAGLADELFEVLRPLSDKPIALFGHSMGASVGFEVATRLEAAGVGPTTLFASGRRAPSLNVDDGVHLLDDAGLIAEVKKLGGAGSQLLDDPEILQLVLPAIRADYTAAETYRSAPGRTVSCPVHALCGDADPKVSVDEARAWSAHTTGAFDLKVFPGDHFYIDDNAPAVLDHMRAHLTR
ncbi:thioesterase II family protein [Actinocrispum wychmicini]|uniref:Surfactin synthase thioesterase subunit n=1 Tax=Actinocrispum wychmicini TaxID=1213861 RepID=A0A4R2J6B1_9PSEU|nr:alpha/beta fold hydrolase [Actinocrispum wychmicini]TCO53567.1 surfactin synthase thioesterase subunit [Actinocrispum wychmicini]